MLRSSNCLKIIRTVIFLFLFTPTGAHQGPMKGPQNTLGIVGSNVTLTCSISTGNCSDIDWEKSSLENYSEAIIRTIFAKGAILQPYQDRYSINTSSGCDLVIYDVKLTDAGRFTCRLYISGKTVEKIAHLTVLENKPKCAINASLNDTVEGDRVHLTCEVTYDGTGKSFMIWKSVANAMAHVENGKTISRSFSIDASAPEIRSFTCVTSFEAKVVINGSALNIPTIACETPAIEVLFPVRNVTLSPSFSYYSPGTIIACAAKGRPSPSFKWQVRESENEVTWMDIPNQNSSVFTTSNVTSRQYRCVAMNVVRGRNYSANSSEFQVNNTDDGSVTDELTTVHPLAAYLPLIVPVAAGVAVGIIVLIILLIICFCVRSCPGYRCCHSEKILKVKKSEEEPLRESPDGYGNSSQFQPAPKAKPRSAPTSEPPKRPQNAPPQPKPRTDVPRAGAAQPYQHEEVTYAELARDTAPRQFVVKNNNEPQESVYADVTTA